MEWFLKKYKHMLQKFMLLCKRKGQQHWLTTEYFCSYPAAMCLKQACQWDKEKKKPQNHLNCCGRLETIHRQITGKAQINNVDKKDNRMSTTSTHSPTERSWPSLSPSSSPSKSRAKRGGEGQTAEIGTHRGRLEESKWEATERRKSRRKRRRTVDQIGE